MSFSLQSFQGKASDLPADLPLTASTGSDREARVAKAVRDAIAAIATELGDVYIAISSYGHINDAPDTHGDAVVLNVSVIPDPTAPTPPLVSTGVLQAGPVQLPPTDVIPSGPGQPAGIPSSATQMQPGLTVVPGETPPVPTTPPSAPAPSGAGGPAQSSEASIGDAPPAPEPELAAASPVEVNQDVPAVPAPSDVPAEPVGIPPEPVPASSPVETAPAAAPVDQAPAETLVAPVSPAPARTLYVFSGDPSTVDQAQWPVAPFTSTDGHQLYYFVGDVSPGQQAGAGISPEWTVYTGGYIQTA